MTLAQIIEKAKSDRAAKVAARNGIADDLAALRSADEVDEAVVSEKRAAKNAIDAEIDALSERIADLESEQARDEAMARLQAESVPSAKRAAYDEVARVGKEERTYNPSTDRDGNVFVKDVAAAFLGDYSARDRVARHMQEERVERSEYLNRAVGTGAFAGLTVPQYLTDLFAPAVAARRPFADICNKHSLPADGMTVNISQITTASSVADQSSENSAVSETNMDDTLLTLSVYTAGGQQTISRQAIDRSTGVEGIVLDDLFRRYATNLDSALLNKASVGLTNVATAVTYTDGTPTAAELYPKILNASANLEAALLGEADADYVVMHSRRWAWLQSQVGSTWPAFAQPSIPYESMGVNNGVGYNKGIRGILPNGLKVVVDNNVATNKGVGTNEDEIYVIASSECHLWEDPSAPVFIRAEQPAAASLGVLLVVYGYYAFTHNRYASAQQKIGGTGLVTPTF